MPSISDASLLCPRPRHLPCSSLDSKCQSELNDSRFEILDMIFTKGNYNPENNYHQVPWSPPFFMGSPPCRAPNPVTQNVEFGNQKLNLLSPTDEYSASSKHKNSKCSRPRRKQKPAAVRIQGFNIRSIPSAV
ncbi:hypothetical protein POM88_016140 [Heracleum sosnowskyi]|uniref:Uncharacterized protein n=1 Tax=Heracleum sosnowskyi TaxID=360622 RepID=A0AAD8MX29_9APIA|nr:hypothetical protein POM88_016140 [Heracleum sosnowskyi]